MAKTSIFDSKIVPVDSLDIFDKEKLTCSIIDTQEFSLLPSLTVTHGSPVVFEIPSQTTSFLSPNMYIDVVLTVQKKVKDKEEYEGVSSTDKMTLEAFPFHTLWSTVQIAMNDVVINNKNDKYPYLAYFDRAHLTDEETHKIYRDLEVGELNEAGTSPDATGTEQDKRRQLITSDQFLFLRGKLVIPILQQSRYFLPSTNITITLYPTDDKFRVVTEDETLKLKVNMKSIRLIGHRLIPNAQLLLDTMNALSEMKARYPILRFEPQLFEIPAQSQICEKILTLPTSKVPRMVFLSTFDSDGVYGKQSKSAYRAKATFLESVYIQIEDQKYPTVPYNGTTREGQIKMFSDYKQNTSQLMGGKMNMMDFDRYSKDHAMVSINLDRFHGTERTTSDTDPSAVTLPRTGSCSLHIKTSSPLSQTRAVIAILVYNDTITFNESGVPHSDY